MTVDIDVVVIGAGAAGLAAGTRLREASIPFRILEAASSPGGRAATDTTTLGVPFDLGCHWLHDARANPFTDLAAKLGFRVGANNPNPRRLHLGTRFASPEEREQADAEVDQVFEAIIAAGQAGRDIPASEAAGPPGRFGPLARHWLELMSAAGPDAISCVDFALYHDTDDNWPVLDGYGALVLAAAGALPVTLDCPVARIDRSGPRLKLETAQGILTCGAVIVAVSTAVMASGRLAFAPELPADLAEAFAALPLGFAEKVALLFEEDVFGVPERTACDAIDLDHPARAGASALLKPAGAPAALVHVAGPEAQAIAAEGEGALVAFALDVLGAAFGAGLKTKVRRSLVTRWAAMPYIGGAYSCALPGHAALRARLHEPLDERIFFAGEALGREAFSTCHGAHLSGLAAADAALAALKSDR
ncbi:flavin monoamine oxidase family protein [Xanthobacter versatilis]|uniref:flavin monoamine oxidase family protein n=1 Tax=Xanthobacter autotrophicus (strain ATCC BAA-1158 / Py2) TaxID=78245 RepID=UPI003728F5BE